MSLPIQTITAYKYKFYRIKHKKEYEDENGEILKHSVDEKLLPIDFSGKDGVNPNALLEEFFKEIQVLPVKSEYNKKVLKVESYEIGETHLNKFRTHCLTNAGFYGRLLKIYNIKKDLQTKSVELNEAVLATYNVFFYYQENSTENICIFHRCGRGGCKTIFIEHFNRFLKKHKLRLELKAIVSEEMQEKIKNGRILEMNLIKTSNVKKKNTDAADKMEEEESIIKHREYSLSINLRGKRREACKDLIDKLVFGEVPVKEVFEFIPEDLDFNETSCLMEIGNQQRTVYKSNLYALLTEHDITNLLKYDKYNYPTKESLSFVVDEYVSKLF